MPTYDDAIKTWTPEQWQSFGLGGGIVDKDNNLISSDSNGLGSSVTNYLGGQKLGDIASFAGTGFGIYDSLFGMGSKVAKENLSNMKKQGTVLNQNIESNKATMENTKNFRNIMNNAGTSGLGSSLTKTATV